MDLFQQVQLENSWKNALKEEFDKPYLPALFDFIKAEKAQGKTIYPPGSLIFNAFNSTAFEQVKVVILGQDPYHGQGQAHGLCFSVQYGVKPPPSLVNIYKELETDLGCKPPNHGNLQDWANQGVFLLNAILTVQANQAASHQNKGWETFTDQIIAMLGAEKEPKVFLLWGNYALKKEALIKNPYHLILKAPHPSPLSAHRGFLGCKHFSKTNEFLTFKGIPPIDWNLSTMKGSPEG